MRFLLTNGWKYVILYNMTRDEKYWKGFKMHRLFWYLAGKLGYGLVLHENKHFHYTGIYTYMPREIIVYFI